MPSASALTRLTLKVKFGKNGEVTGKKDLLKLSQFYPKKLGEWIVTKYLDMLQPMAPMAPTYSNHWKRAPLQEMVDNGASSSTSWKRPLACSPLAQTPAKAARVVPQPKASWKRPNLH